MQGCLLFEEAGKPTQLSRYKVLALSALVATLMLRSSLGPPKPLLAACSLQLAVFGGADISKAACWVDGRTGLSE